MANAHFQRGQQTRAFAGEATLLAVRVAELGPSSETLVAALAELPEQVVAVVRLRPSGSGSGGGRGCGGSDGSGGSGELCLGLAQGICALKMHPALRAFAVDVAFAVITGVRSLAPG
jgi:hypothetical protein